MRLLNAFFLGLVIWGLGVPSSAIDENVLKEEIIKSVESLTAGATIQAPSPGLLTRSPAGPKLYRRTANAVVFIVTRNSVTGSGVVLSRTGWIITNWHVVKGESVVGVLFKPPTARISLKKEDIFFARVFKSDPTRDLALLIVKKPPPTISIAQLGSLKSIAVGQDVYAISHPEGLLWSYTEGVISQIRPKYEVKDEAGTVRATMIQTQAVISRGSSGGALFGTDGRLVGIIFGFYGPGLNFAIAVNEVYDFVVSSIGEAP